MITTEQKNLFNLTRQGGFQNPLGDALLKQKGVVVGKYSFAKQGGAVGSVNLLEDLNTGVPAKLPVNAIITNVYIDIITAFTSTSNDGTIAISAQSAGDLLAAVDADTLSAQVQGIPNDTVANMIKLTAERTLTATFAVHAILSGKANVFVEYVISE